MHHEHGRRPPPGSAELAVARDIATLCSAQRLRVLVAPGQVAPSHDFSHNDVLALGTDATLIRAIDAATSGLPLGSGASRLLGGDHPTIAEAEVAFAAFKGSESALLLPSGYQANVAVLSALRYLPCAIFSDELNHASIIDGIQLARFERSRRTIFRHRDYEHLAAALKGSSAEINVIVTESVFSMDGDLANLPLLNELAGAHRGLLLIDEAHAIGVLGPHGRGLSAAHDLDGQRTVTLNPCGKALAGQGAFVASPSWFRDFLVNRSRGLIYSTGISPRIAAGLRATLATLPSYAERRARVATLAERCREIIGRHGFETAKPTTTHILPVICGSDARALSLSRHLKARGIFAPAIRPPTVPDGRARLRLAIHAAITDQALDDLDDALQSFLASESRTQPAATGRGEAQASTI